MKPYKINKEFSRQGRLNIRQGGFTMKNKIWKKIGLCTGFAVIFGLVSSGVFTSVSMLTAKSTENTVVQTAAQTTGTTESTSGTASSSSSSSSSIGSTKDANDSASTESTDTSGDLTVTQVAANSMPAMVAITNTSVENVQNYFGGNGFGSSGNGSSQGQTAESVSMGTGVIIGETDTEILIATNEHVIADATTLSVAFVDDTAASATVKGSDESADLAVIAVEKSALSSDTLSQIKVISIGSSDDLVVGEQVVAIGNALGYGQSVSTGVVSALHRTLTSSDGSTEGTSDGLIQTDAAINPGNSGGALLNMKGELIGINSAKYADTEVEGMGYSIPISSALPILESLENGTSSSSTSSSSSSGTTNGNGAYLGISCATITSEYSTYYGIPEGVYVKSVTAGSAAANAGIQQGDIITAVGSTTVSSVDDLTSALANYSSGDTATVTVSRTSSSGSQGSFGNGQGSGNGQSSGSSYTTQTLNVTFGSKSDVQSTSAGSATNSR